MASHFLSLHRQDAIACQRAFDRITQGKSNTIPSSELKRYFCYLGAVTAPETLELILQQFCPDQHNHQNQPAHTTDGGGGGGGGAPSFSQPASLNGSISFENNNNNNNNNPSSSTTQQQQHSGATPPTTTTTTTPVVMHHQNNTIDNNNSPSPPPLTTTATAQQQQQINEFTKDDAMNLYAIWLRMVSVSEPPALELLDKRRIVASSSSSSSNSSGDQPHKENSNNNTSHNNNNIHNDANSSPVVGESSGHHHYPSSVPTASSSTAAIVNKNTHWTDRFSSYFGNRNVMLLTITRTLVVMLFTLVHWFSVFFRDADSSLRCGHLGIGLDCGHTGLMLLDLFVEYYAGEYREKVQQVIDERAQEEAKSMLLNTTTATTTNLPSSQQQQEQEKEGSNNNNNTDETRASSPNSMGSGSYSHHHHTSSASNNTNNNNIKLSSSSSSFFHDTWIAFKIFFLSSPKNILGLISLLPLDLFLCAGDAPTAATVLNHIRLLSVIRNYINPNPQTPVPLTTLFADIYYFWMPLWTMTYTFVVVSSLFAILFIILRSNNDGVSSAAPSASSSSPAQIDFLTAMYFVVQTFTTVGFGDVLIHGTAETWFAVVLVLIGMIANATVIGSLVALIQLGNATLVRGDKIRETHAVLHYFSIPRLLQLEILGFQEHVLFSDVVSAFHSDTESFPTAMKDAMILQHRFDVLKQIDPFTKATPDELFFFAKELCTAAFKPEEYLSCCSEPHHGIRILLFGLVDRLDSRGRYIKTLRSGDCFGLDGILSGKDEEYNHKALAYCDLLVISYDDFHNILEAMPKLRKWIVPALKEIEQKIVLEKIIAEKNSLKNNNNTGTKNNNGSSNQNNEDDDDDNEKNHHQDILANTSASLLNNNNNNLMSTAKVLRSPVSMIDTTGGNLSMVHDLRSELRVFRRGLQTLAVSPALNK